MPKPTPRKYKTSYQIYRELQRDKERICERAGSRADTTNARKNFRWTMVNYYRFNRLKFMINMAFHSAEYKLRYPVFPASRFIRLFGELAINDWHYIGILIKPDGLYQPGMFVKYMLEVTQRLAGFKSAIITNRRDGGFNMWYVRYTKVYDEFGRRR